MFTMALLALLYLVLQGFHPGVRKAIFKRDGATCANCGKRWDDGWMLQCAHYASRDWAKDTHNPVHPLHRHPDGGRLLCVECHLSEHTQMFHVAPTLRQRKFHSFAKNKLKGEELHTYKWQERNGWC